jgi:hypothetical protein
MYYPHLDEEAITNKITSTEENFGLITPLNANFAIKEDIDFNDIIKRRYQLREKLLKETIQIRKHEAIRWLVDILENQTKITHQYPYHLTEMFVLDILAQRNIHFLLKIPPKYQEAEVEEAIVVFGKSKNLEIYLDNDIHHLLHINIK